MTLKEAIEAIGWKMVITKYPARHKDKLGKGSSKTFAIALKNGRVAVVGNSWQYAYHVSHEIAESMCNFKHSETLFMIQANLLADWHQLRSGMSLKLLGVYAPRN